MLLFLCNPFNDPNDPWYYVIGVIFLLLIFGALALYIILTNKKTKDGQAEAETTEQPIETENTETDDAEQQAEAKQAEEPEPPQDSSDAEENMQEEK